MSKPVFEWTAEKLALASASKLDLISKLADNELSRREQARIAKKLGKSVAPIPSAHRKPLEELSDEEHPSVRARTLGTYEGLPEVVRGPLVTRTDEEMGATRYFVMVQTDEHDLPILVNVLPSTIEEVSE